MFEPFLTAPTTAKLVNLLVLIFAFLAWVSTMVVFSSPLHTMKQSGNSITFSVHWNSLKFDGDSLSLRGSCQSSGQGTLAMNVFAFLITMPLFFETLGRLMGLALPVIGDNLESQLKFELFASGIANFFIFLAICIWGGGCFGRSSVEVAVATTTEVDQSSVTGVGFGLQLAVFFFLFINIFVLHMMRSSRPEWQVGKGSSGQSDSYAPRDSYDGAGATNAAPESYSYSSS